MSDRTVHAVCEDGREIVRYERAGKWYIEPKEGPRRPVTCAEAASVAAEAWRGDGAVWLGRPGGGAFDRIVRAQSAVDKSHLTVIQPVQTCAARTQSERESGV